MSVGVRTCLVLVLATSIRAFTSAQLPDPAGSKTASERLGSSSGSRLLVIQAEDLGMAHSIDKASFEALVKGWVTTAGVLVPGPWFPEVLRWSRSHPNADLGIRLDLNADWSSYRWRPVSGAQKGSGLTDPGGYLSSSQISVAQHATPSEVEDELRAQDRHGQAGWNTDYPPRPAYARHDGESSTVSVLLEDGPGVPACPSCCQFSRSNKGALPRRSPASTLSEGSRSTWPACQ